MKRPAITARQHDDATLKRETGRSRKDWYALIDKSGAEGRAAINKVLLAEKLDAWWMSTLNVEYEAHKGTIEKDGRPKGYALCSTKTINATPEKVFTAFTKAKGLVGTVVKSKPGKSVVFTWDAPGFADGSQVEALFQPKDGKCGIVVNHTRVQTREDADAVRAAWSEALDTLKGSIEG